MDVTQALLVVILSVIVRDGILAWVLINWIIRASTPGVPIDLPGTPPDPGIPPVIVPPPQLPPTPRFTDITATSFGGAGDSNASAYGGMVDPNVPGVALPFHFTGTRPVVRAFCNGKSVDCPITDVGPWNINDPYWQLGTRPQAESGKDATGRATNLAGIDLTPAAWTALGVSNPNTVKTKIDWDFVYILDAKVPTGPTTPVKPPTGGTPPWLTLARSLIGVNENDNPSQIVGWSKAIAAKYPEMASYSALYTSATIPWCGQFVAYVLSQNGIRPVFGPTDTDKYLWAYAWKDWGTDASGHPQPGDVLVFKWSSGGGHVTLYDHEVDDDYYHCTGGNQGNPGQVSTESMPMSACIAIRRPPSA